MSNIIAQKGKFTRTFTSETWKRLGKEKGGWKIVPSEVKGKSTAQKTESTGTPENKQNLNPKVAHSTDEGVNTDSAISVIKGMKTEPEITEYIKGDERVTVQRASVKRIEELKA